LYLGTAPVGTPVTGIVGAISFGPQATAGVYTVVASNTLTGCSVNMSGSFTIAINAAPPLIICKWQRRYLLPWFSKWRHNFFGFYACWCAIPVVLMVLVGALSLPARVLVLRLLGVRLA